MRCKGEEKYQLLIMYNIKVLLTAGGAIKQGYKFPNERRLKT